MKSSLNDILKVCGDRQIAVCRELTKVHEEVFRGSVSEAIAHFDNPRGEFTLVLDGYHSVESQAKVSEEETIRVLSRMKGEGLKARESVLAVAHAQGLTRKEVYRLWLKASEPDVENGT